MRDARGDVWELTIDLVACRRVRDLARVNLLTLRVEQLFSALADLIAVAEICYAVCRPQLEIRGISEEEFLRRLEVDPEPIVEELLARLADFFRRLGRAAMATQMTTAATATKRLTETMTTEELEAMTAATFDWMASQIRKSSSGAAAMNSPASLDATPTSQALPTEC